MELFSGDFLGHARIFHLGYDTSLVIVLLDGDHFYKKIKYVWSPIRKIELHPIWKISTQEYFCKQTIK